MFRKRKRIVIWLTYRSRTKILLSLLMIAVMVLIFSSDLSTMRTWSAWSLPLSGKVIAIDAGHGGADGGAVSREGVIEKDINLAISLFLRDYLQQAGAVVVMTREEDKDLADPDSNGPRKRQDLLRRAELIMRKKVNLVVSIHVNSIPSSRWHGAQTFYYPNHVDNKLLAALIQDEIKGSLHNTTREVNTVDSVYLLKTLQIPTALVEIGFLSNPEEARLMSGEKYQRLMSEAIYRGILRYCSGEKRIP